MVLGLYEKEILNLINGIHPKQYSAFIDVGAADGYYACGMLVSGKVKKATCFEKSSIGQQVILSNWRENGSVGEISVLGEATADSLLSLPKADLENSLVLIDIEGFEFELLTKETIKALASCTVIVEIHNWIHNFMDHYERLLEDMNTYFHIEVLECVERNTQKLNELKAFSDDNRLLLVSEGPPCVMRFLKLTPK